MPKDWLKDNRNCNLKRRNAEVKIKRLVLLRRRSTISFFPVNPGLISAPTMSLDDSTGSFAAIPGWQVRFRMATLPSCRSVPSFTMRPALRACLESGEMPDRRRYSCRARRIHAGIPTDFRLNQRTSGGKRCPETAFCRFSYRFLLSGCFSFCLLYREHISRIVTPATTQICEVPIDFILLTWYPLCKSYRMCGGIQRKG